MRKRFVIKGVATLQLEVTLLHKSEMYDLLELPAISHPLRKAIEAGEQELDLVTNPTGMRPSY